MYMGRKTEAEIRKDGYYKYPNIVSKYYLDKPVGYVNGDDSKLEIRDINTTRWFKCNHVAYYEGMLGQGYYDVDTKTVLGASVDINFRNLQFELMVFNHKAFLCDLEQRDRKPGFIIGGKMPDDKHIMFATHSGLMKFSPVAKPKYTFDLAFVYFLLEHDRQEYGKFHRLVRNCAVTMLRSYERTVQTEGSKC